MYFKCKKKLSLTKIFHFKPETFIQVSVDLKVKCHISAGTFLIYERLSYEFIFKFF